MNLEEIARRARVSISTASRAINRVPSVSPYLSRRIWKVVEELGYYPNTQARSLVSGKSKIFGLIVSEITDPFFPEVVQVFENIAVRHDYEILLTCNVREPRAVQNSVRRMIERRVDGVAVMTFGLEELMFDELKLRRIPLVFVDIGPHAPRVSNISIDYLHGIRQAIQHLAALRHERIAFITGPLSQKSAIARRDAFLRSMQEIALADDPLLIEEGDHTIKGAMEAAGRLFQSPSMPTAILCSNDLTAIGVMRKSIEQGIVIPHDLSLVGFDDGGLAQFMLPPLTTVQMSREELARLAFQALLEEVEREQPIPTGVEYELQTTLALRRSTAMAPTHNRHLDAC